MASLVNALAAILPAKPVGGSNERRAPSPDSFLGLAALQIGQSVRARVLSIVGHEATVLINDQPVHMELPGKVGVGDNLKLVYSGRNPNPLFLLTGIDPHGQVPATLSEAAQVLDTILLHSPDPRAAASVHGAQPLIEEAPTLPALIAIQLRAALTQSGLFYESHLAGWMNGEVPLAALRHEPQGQMAPAYVLSAESFPEPGEPLSSRSAHTAGGELAIPGEMRALIAQQLQLLENPGLVWRGEVWPGQTMEWEIEREPDSAPHTQGEADTNPAWSTRITLELPHLGRVAVHLGMDARSRFDIRIAARDASAGAILREGQAEIANTLAAAGCDLTNLQVQHDAAA